MRAFAELGRVPGSTEGPFSIGAERRRYKRPQSVLVLVYTAAGQVLLLRRIRPRGFWQSVTGSLRWGESRQRAARRELFEETARERATSIDDDPDVAFDIDGDVDDLIESIGAYRRRQSRATVADYDPEALARLAVRADVVTFDLENVGTDTLDALTRANLADEIEHIWEADRKTCVLITNDVDEAIVRSIELPEPVREGPVPDDLVPPLTGAYWDNPDGYDDGCHLEPGDVVLPECVYGDPAGEQQGASIAPLLGS